MDPERTRYARGLFAGIAPEYDRMGAALSFGQEPRWRRFLVSRVHAIPGSWVLDVATGTGLVARELARANVRVVGLDQSPAMVTRGLREVRERGLQERVRFTLGQAQALPFADGTFDAVTFTYLLRYVDDPAATVAELVRTVRPGGVMASLEFHVPPEPWARAGWQAYTRAVRAQGFDVTVVTRFPFVVTRFPVKEGRRGRGLRRWVLVETMNGCRVRRLRLPAEGLLEAGLDLLLRGIARATPTARVHGQEAIDFLFACLAVPWVLAQRPQVIVVEQGPVWLALPLRVCARAGTALVLQISDVKSAAMARGRYGPVPAGSIDLNARLEARVWRSATRLVTVTERLRAIIAARSRLPTSAVDLIPNGVELDCIEPTSAAIRERCKRALGLSARFVAIYAGTLGSAHDLETVVRAAALLDQDPAGRDVSLLIIGEGPRRRALAQLIAELGAANVRLLPGVPLEALRPFLGAADVGLSTERRGLSDTLRAKLYLYMGARLPILATDDGGESGAHGSRRRRPAGGAETPHWRVRSSACSAIRPGRRYARTPGTMRKPIMTGGCSPPTSPAWWTRRLPRAGDVDSEPRLYGRNGTPALARVSLPPCEISRLTWQCRSRDTACCVPTAPPQRSDSRRRRAGATACRRSALAGGGGRARSVGRPSSGCRPPPAPGENGSACRSARRSWPGGERERRGSERTERPAAAPAARRSTA
jgi:ubiquinone/menaquinone biosynthesis methyltransferase